MSLQNILDMKEQRKDQVELSPDSETFSIKNEGLITGTFEGIFDEATFTGSGEKGNVATQKTHPSIMIAEVPDGLTRDTTVIIREDGSEYTFFRYWPDDKGLPTIWLY